MKGFLVVLCAVILLLAISDAAWAGLGKPLPKKANGEQIKSSEAYKKALDTLQRKGYSKDQADTALAKLGPERLALLGQDAEQIKGGGDLFGFLLFVLFVALIVWLIIVLVEASAHGRYRY